MLIDLTLDIEKGGNRFSTLDNPITLRQGDAMAYTFQASIRQGGAVLDLTGMTVRFYALRPDGGKVIDGDNVSMVSAADGMVSYDIPSQLTQAAGDIPTAYFRITSGDWSASTENTVIRVVPSIGIEAQGGDYIPEIDRLLNALEAQRVNYANAEDVRSSEFAALVGDVTDARGRANSAADRCEAFLESFKVNYDDLTDDLKQKIAAMASAGVVFATQDEIDEAYENVIAPAIGTENQLEGLTQEDYDFVLAKVFG